MAALGRYIVKRSIQGVITLFVVTIIVFVLFDAMPGSPIDRFRLDPTVDPARLEQLNRTFGINDPYPVKMGKFIWAMFSLDFGDSFVEGKPVSEVIAAAAPRTLFLFGGAVLIEYLFGVLIGTFIAWRRGRFSEGTAVVGSLFFYNMPSFWIGLILLWLFAFTIDIFPLHGFSDPEETARVIPLVAGLGPNNPFFQLVDLSYHAALPMLALVLISSAGTILLMQTSMLEVMGEDFILTARAKGLRERIVRRRHAARNAYLPVVTSLTISLAFVVGGAIILESIFSYFGLGYYFLQSIFNQDQFLAGAILWIIAVLVIFGNIVADILYGVLDPRVRL
ncbi:MAG: ABC transporter permease [Methanobacteriota archaeon]|nr:MAG: ABC transporter permease [Euryarchaeota archaeon]